MEKQLGSEGKLKVELVNGQLVISVEYDGKGVDGAVVIKVEPEYFVDQLGALIPGDTVVEQITLGALKMGLKNIKV